MISGLPAIPTAGTPITADAVNQIEKTIALQVGQIADIEVLQEWRAKAAALESYLRSRELQRPMLGAQRRVEARIGQLLGEAKRGSNQHSVTTESSQIQKDDRADFRVLARGFECLNEDEQWRKSRRALVSDVRRKLGLIPETPELPDGQFRCVVADPPWKLDTGPKAFGGTIEAGHDSLEYEQMSLDDIKALPVADRSAEDAHLYLWTTNKYVEAAYDVARAWGYKPSVLLTWAKTPRGVGLGDAYKLTAEFIVYARRGSLKERDVCVSTWFNWPRGKHSQKPEDFYLLVERMASPPFLEMFARRPRPGWTTWGHEAGEQQDDG